MSERKVLNKYYPPDFDPSKIPHMKLPKNRQYTVRLMTLFNIRWKEEDYCGVCIYRFYIKCTRCLQEISFKTDPRNTYYDIEAGVMRNFMTLKLVEEEKKKEMKEEQANNQRMLLENRTNQSRIELERLESLEELKELNARHFKNNFNVSLAKYHTSEVQERLRKLQDEKILNWLNRYQVKGKRRPKRLLSKKL